MATAEKLEKVNGRMAKKEKAGKAESGSKMDALMEQNPNLKTAFQQIEKQFGEGSIMPLGGDVNLKIAGIPTGSLSLDVALGGQVHNPVGPEVGSGAFHRLAIANVGMKEAVVRLVFDGRKRSEVAGIGQRIDVEHLTALLEHQVPHQRRADEARTPRNNHAHQRSSIEK